VAVEDQLDLGVVATLAVVVLEQLREAVVVEEILEGVEAALGHPGAQVEIADDDTNELHDGPTTPTTKGRSSDGWGRSCDLASSGEWAGDGPAILQVPTNAARPRPGLA